MWNLYVLKAVIWIFKSSEVLLFQKYSYTEQNNHIQQKKWARIFSQANRIKSLEIVSVTGTDKKYLRGFRD